MIALVYLAILVAAGDAIGRRWLTYRSTPQRWATAFLIGLPLGSWLSYLFAQALGGAGDRLLLGDLVAAWWLLLVTIWLWRHPRRPEGEDSGPRPTAGRGSDRWDLATIAAITVLVGWMMTSTYSYEEGRLVIASALWSDFGPTSAIAQSFAVGDNFPTEYPHYALEPIRYHFLYYFQVGNLTHLGLDPATANNVMSTGSMVAMLVLVMALGRRLFRSRLVGRLGAILFFFHGSLSFLPWLAGLGSIERAVETLPNLNEFIASGFPYRGETWGIWTQIVFLNQRHLASAIGILLVIVVFLLERLPERAVPDEGAGRPLRDRLASAAAGAAGRARSSIRRPVAVVRDVLRDPALPGFALCGALAGMLPLWNGSMFVAAAALLAVWLVLFPNRRSMIVLAISASVLAVPQLLWVRPGTMAGEQTYPAFYWGYVLSDPGPAAVASYFGFIFGPKLLLTAIALVAASWRQWRVFLAFSGLVALAFLVQLSVEVLANHKFINAWLIVVNVFAARGLLRLWQARRLVRLPARLVATGLAAIILAGGLIDLMPVKNQGKQVFGMDGDALYEWVATQTHPHDVFLTDIYVVNQILLAGRKIYFGWPYYAWSAGYDVGPRETWYRDTFAERSPRGLAGRLRAAGIDYVAIDDGLRAQTFAPRLNEELFREHFETAFADSDGSHGNIAIYRVPVDRSTVESLPEAPATDMYTGGTGAEPGRLNGPRGLAVERSGSLLVADSGNDRIQRFASNGNLVDVLGTTGNGPGQLREPVGVAVEAGGGIWVADAGNGRLQQLGPDGAFIRDWSGPPGGFGGLADVATDGDRVFALDGSHGRVVRLDPDGTVLVWGEDGGSTGLSTPTGIAARSGRVVVADTGNARVVVYDQDGAELASWSVFELANGSDHPPDVALDESGTVWVSSPETDAILVFEADGTALGTLSPGGAEALDGPTGLALRPSGTLFVANAGSDRIGLVLQARP